jgi:hypothetical protein
VYVDATLFFDRADAALDPLVELVEHALIVADSHRLTAHVDDRAHVDEAIERGHRGGPVPGAVEHLEPELCAAPGVGHHVPKAPLIE